MAVSSHITLKIAKPINSNPKITRKRQAATLNVKESITIAPIIARNKIINCIILTSK